MGTSLTPSHTFDEIDGHVVHSLTRGEGPDLILLPSLVISSVTYRATLRSLSRLFKVRILDLPGAGLSQNPTEALSIEDYGRFVVKFMERKGVGKAVLVGHSNSGPIAIEVARHRPDLIRHLVICDSIGVDGTRSLSLALLARAIDSAVMEPGFALVGHTDLIWNSLLHPQTFQNQIKIFKSCDLLADAAEINVPTLVAWGRKDQTTPVSGATKLAKALPDAETYICARGSHGWLVEYAEEFTDAVTDFIARSPRVRAREERA